VHLVRRSGLGFLDPWWMPTSPERGVGVSNFQFDLDRSTPRRCKIASVIDEHQPVLAVASSGALGHR